MTDRVVYQPRPGSYCIGRVVVDHCVWGVVWAHSAFTGDPFVMLEAEFDAAYEPDPDLSWDSLMARVPHPGLDGDSI